MAYLNGLQKLLNNYAKVFDTKSADDEGGDFAKRIRARHQLFWSGPESEIIRNMEMNAEDPMEKWKDGFNWQRKLSNKYNAKEFAKKHGCQVTQLYWKGKDLKTLDFDALPDHYVIRPTIGHACKLVFLMKNGLNLMDKKYYSTKELLAILQEAISLNPFQEFLVEEFVRTEYGEYRIPVDYKIHTFNGQIAFIHLVNRLSPCTGSSTFYDENWNQLNYIQTCYPEGVYQNPPACLSEMLEHTRKLSKAYEIFVRIDFYATDKGAVFGEFTPTPAKGRTYKPEGEKILVDYWDKYCNGMI